MDLTDDANPTGPAAALLMRVVGWCVARSLTVIAIGLALTVTSLVYLSDAFSITTGIDGLIGHDVPWRRAELAIEHAFPQMADDIVVVIDGATPERAETAAVALAHSLKARADVFSLVDEGDSSAFFRREGLLYQSLQEVQTTTEGLIDAQPLLGPIAADPSLRGLAAGLESALDGAEGDPKRLARISKPLAVLSGALDTAMKGRPAAVSWQDLLRGAASDRSDRRRILRLTPKVDYRRIAPSEVAVAVIGEAVRQSRLGPDEGVRVRLTGEAVMVDDELANLREAIGPIAGLSLVSMGLILFLATGSVRLIVAIAITVFAGLAVTTALGIMLYGQLNLISVAFLPLFVGLGVDFAVQFVVRYSAGDPSDGAAALVRTAGAVGSGIALAGLAAAIGFLSFLPTAYKGVSELGGIAGIGILVALLFTLTLLPAMVQRLGARPTTPRWPPPAVFKPRHQRLVLPLFGFMAVAGLVALSALRFDFDPLSLRSPGDESVATYLDLARSADTTPNTLDILQLNLADATALATTLERAPAVRAAFTAQTLIPREQAAKLALIGDARLLLDTAVSPLDVAPPPADRDLVVALQGAAARLRSVAAVSGPADGADARRAAEVFDRLAAAPPALRLRAQMAVMRDLPAALDTVRAALEAEPVSLETLPADLRRSWIAPSGIARIEVWPRGEAGDRAAIARFVDGVRGVTLDVSGAPVVIREAGATVLNAFLEAAGLSMLAIAVLLLLTTRSLIAVLLTLAPVFLTVLLTLASCALMGQAINLENIIALPLVLGIGVSFNIYLVAAWRRGADPAVKANLARATLFSALTTATAFGALLLSAHPGTASLGLVLTVALVWTLATSLVFQPALLSWAIRRRLISVLPSPRRVS